MSYFPDTATVSWVFVRDLLRANLAAYLKANQFLSSFWKSLAPSDERPEPGQPQGGDGSPRLDQDVDVPRLVHARGGEGDVQGLLEE